MKPNAVKGSLGSAMFRVRFGLSSLSTTISSVLSETFLSSLPEPLSASRISSCVTLRRDGEDEELSARDTALDAS